MRRPRSGACPGPHESSPQREVLAPERLLDGRLELDRLDELPDEEISAELTAVKGLGQWSADMFLIFYLGRPDVLPVGDLGVRRAAGIVYAMPEMPAPAALYELGEPW